MSDPDREQLLEQLRRYPAGRYPVQRATTLFHLGSAQLQDGEALEARDSLSAARRLFSSGGMALEAAKSINMLGVALRDLRLMEEAAAAFGAAVKEFDSLAKPLEAAAAAYNLGLVLHQCGDVDAANTAWSRARSTFQEAGWPAQSAAAAREQAASLLQAGRPEQAVPLLREAVTLSEQAGDLTGLGYAANTLGLAHLALADSAAATTAFRSAVGAFPRSLRPAQYAMAKANLALAYQRAGELGRARLAARQALTVTSADQPVRTLAQLVLQRSTKPEAVSETTDLFSELAAQGQQRWGAIMREEVLRWCDAILAEREAAVATLLDELVARPDSCYDLAESLFAVLLELPPDQCNRLLSTIALTTGRGDRERGDRIHRIVASALARFPLPQWQRLVASLNAAAKAHRLPTDWR